MATIEVKVPDIGNYSNVPVIEVLVKPGDTVGKDQGLVTLESDKATMEVPSSAAGVVKELKVKVGDEVSEGSVVAVIEAAGKPRVPQPDPRLAANHRLVALDQLAGGLVVAGANAADELGELAALGHGASPIGMVPARARRRNPIRP